MDDEGVTYKMVRSGTSKGRDILTDNLGHCYTQKPTKSNNTTYWRCAVRNLKVNCRATVIGDASSYRQGIHQHLCATAPGASLARTITAKVCKYIYIGLIMHDMSWCVCVCVCVCMCLSVYHLCCRICFYTSH